MKRLIFAFALICATVTGLAQTEPTQCEGITGKHVRCLRTAQPNKKFCKQHDVALPHCKATTGKNLPCKNAALAGKNVCYVHRFVVIP